MTDNSNILTLKCPHCTAQNNLKLAMPVTRPSTYVCWCWHCCSNYILEFNSICAMRTYFILPDGVGRQGNIYPHTAVEYIKE